MIKHGCKLNVTRQLGKSHQVMPCSILVQSRVWHWEWMWGQYRVINYHSQALPVTAKEERVVPYHCPKPCSLLWKKASDNISVLRFTLCTFHLVGLKSLVQMDTGSKGWLGALVTGCSHCPQGGTTCQSLRAQHWWFRAAVRRFKDTQTMLNVR